MQGEECENKKRGETKVQRMQDRKANKTEEEGTRLEKTEAERQEKVAQPCLYHPPMSFGGGLSLPQV